MTLQLGFAIGLGSVWPVLAQTGTPPATPPPVVLPTKPVDDKRSTKDKAQDAQLELANEYYRRDEWAKAATIFKELSDKPATLLPIYDKYTHALRQLLQWDDLERYLRKVIKKHGADKIYQVDLALFYQQRGKPDKAADLVADLKKDLRNNTEQTKLAAAHALKGGQSGWAKTWLLHTRETLKQPELFSAELAEVYKIEGDNDQMFAEVLQNLEREGQPVFYVQATLQNLISKPEELETLVRLLNTRLAANPTHNGFTEILLWAYLQQKEWALAFVQARALDRRMGMEGNKSMEVAHLAVQSQEYQQAVRIYEYVRETWANRPVAYNATRQLLQTRESLVKSAYPVVEQDVRLLINEYKALLQTRMGAVNRYENLRSMALLYGFYLGKTDSAMTLLQEVVSAPGVQPELRDKSKMDLADLYIIQNEPWESTLLYSQVEKSQKETVMGHEAKLRNARLSYFKGEFLLAQEHLDVLMLATSRETANDAMELGLRIQNNTILDSASPALLQFSKVELMLFQNKVPAALQAMDAMLKQYPKDPIRDDLLWLRSKTYRKIREPQLALADLDSILKYHNDDTYGDDAQFTRGLILEQDLGKKQEAMEAFEMVLKNYPASVFAAEARKRFRLLRGDTL